MPVGQVGTQIKLPDPSDKQLDDFTRIALAILTTHSDYAGKAKLKIKTLSMVNHCHHLISAGYDFTKISVAEDPDPEDFFKCDKKLPRIPTKQEIRTETVGYAQQILAIAKKYNLPVNTFDLNNDGQTVAEEIAPRLVALQAGLGDGTAWNQSSYAKVINHWGEIDKERLEDFRTNFASIYFVSDIYRGLIGPLD